MAIDRIIIMQRIQEHVTNQSTLVIGILPEEQWNLLMILSPLEATRKIKKKPR